MEENVLKNDECFLEFPDKLLEVESDIYVLFDGCNYKVVRSNFKSICFIDDIIYENIKYISVLDGEILLEETKTYQESNIISSLNKNIKLIKLRDVYQLSDEQKKYLTNEEVVALNNYKEEDFKLNKNIRKYYF